jgi:hypothetical protein
MIPISQLIIIVKSPKNRKTGQTILRRSGLSN